MASSGRESQRKLWGMVTRRERWGLSWRGWLFVAALLGGGALAFGLGSYSFFAITKRVEARLLVVEGWVDVHAIRAAANEFESGAYERVVATGGPVPGMGGYTNDYNTSASVGAGRLKQAGVPEARVHMAPSRVLARDRTYNAGLALRAWCEQNQVPLTSINVVTADVHARRTRLLFEKALGEGVKVGVISVPHPDYDARRWWRYSQGVRAIFGEWIAYVYARFFFHP